MNAAIALAPAAVVVRRTIAASAEDLFDAWLDPEALAIWMRPGRHSQAPQARVEPRVGGRYEINMHADSGVIPHSGVYRVIDRPRRLVFTWVSPHTGERDSLVTVDFLPRDKRTEVVVTHEQLPESQARRTQRWLDRALEKLDAFRAPEPQLESEFHANIRLTTFRWVPPFAQGLVKDLRVRWALEEAGLAYEEKLLNLGEHKSPAHRALQPFGQVPVYEEDGLTLFETGAIVMHLGQNCPTLLPIDPAKRARAITWMFAAMNSVEPAIQNLTSIDLFFSNEEWAKLRRAGAEEQAQSRLDGIAASLAGRDYLEGEFTAGDLLMVTVLRILRHTEPGEEHAGAGGLPGALRGPTRVPARTRGAAGAFREVRARGLRRVQNGSPITNRHPESVPASR